MIHYQIVPKAKETTQNRKSRVDSLGADVGVLVAGVAHLAEARDEEVVAAMVRRRVLLYVGELHKLWKGGGVGKDKRKQWKRSLFSMLLTFILPG